MTLIIVIVMASESTKSTYMYAGLYKTVYMILISPFVYLVIIAHPEITRPPQSKIVAENDQDITFSCTASGYPTPEISWIYRGNEVHPGNGDPRPESSTQGQSVTSTLTFSSVSGMDSGKVKCVARPPPGANTGRIQLNTAEKPARLSVLGESHS